MSEFSAFQVAYLIYFFLIENLFNEDFSLVLFKNGHHKSPLSFSIFCTKFCIYIVCINCTSSYTLCILFFAIMQYRGLERHSVKQCLLLPIPNSPFPNQNLQEGEFNYQGFYENQTCPETITVRLEMCTSVK